MAERRRDIRTAQPVASRLPLLLFAFVLGSVVSALSLGLFSWGWALLVILAAAAGAGWRLRSQRPTDELPCSSVSCCHYLGDEEKDR